MSLIVWNARGLGNPRALDRLRALIRRFSPSLLFLSETWLWGRRAQALRGKLGFTQGLTVDNEGTSGGLALFWKVTWDIEVINFSKYHIDAIVTGNNKVNIPWLCKGDFNEILTWNEKMGGNYRAWTEMNKFRAALDYCHLQDIGYAGPKLTWDMQGQSLPGITDKRGLAISKRDWTALQVPLLGNFFPLLSEFFIKTTGVVTTE
ncbi:Endonuclease/exonuclease/phosphatase [Trema orientale]|uniref:Endonuclease/exonuclease/phosphatase n=1 Tax=Trema orientale TaxID=63057 RepID=A0A2P5BHE6_TREOI|nr:Endonuclease/exonuclease/phosphatase [Trema orientale]